MVFTQPHFSFTDRDDNGADESSCDWNGVNVKKVLAWLDKLKKQGTVHLPRHVIYRQSSKTYRMMIQNNEYWWLYMAGLFPETSDESARLSLELLDWKRENPGIDMLSELLGASNEMREFFIEEEHVPCVPRLASILFENTLEFPQNMNASAVIHILWDGCRAGGDEWMAFARSFLRDPKRSEEVRRECSSLFFFDADLKADSATSTSPSLDRPSLPAQPVSVVVPSV